jgi:hypothetical protein
MKQGAAEQRDVGKFVKASDMTVFAEQADRLAAIVPSFAPTAAEPPTPVPTSIPAPAEHSNQLPVKAVALSAGETYASRGDAMIAAGDLKAARRFYPLGAQAGNERSARLLATLAHDPGIKMAEPRSRAPRRRRVATVHRGGFVPKLYQMQVQQRQLTWLERLFYKTTPALAPVHRLGGAY